MKLPAYFTGFGSKSDGSASLRFASQELSAEQFADLKRNLNGFGWLVFQENPTVDIPDEPAVEDKDKTPSKRLRAVLFLVWNINKIGDFETYYRKEYEKIIDQFKSKLD